MFVKHFVLTVITRNAIAVSSPNKTKNVFGAEIMLPQKVHTAMKQMNQIIANTVFFIFYLKFKT